MTFPASLRCRLLMVVVLAALPLALLAASVQWLLAGYIADLAFEEAQLLGRTAAVRQERVLSGTGQVLLVLGQSVAIRQGHWQDCAGQLGELVQRFPEFSELGVVRADGRIICDSRGSIPGAMVPSPDWVTDGLGRSGLFISGPHKDQDGESVLMGTLPAADETGRINHLIYAAIDLDWLAQEAHSSDIPQSARLRLVDVNGKVLMPEQDAGTILSLPSSALGWNGRAMMDGMGMVRVAVPLSQRGLRVVLDMPSGKLAAGLRARLDEGGLILAAAFVLSLLIAWAGIHRVVLGKVDRLAAAAARIGRGESNVRVGLPEDGGELSRLAQALDDMAARLDRRRAAQEHQLRHSEEQLAIAIKHTPVTVFAQDREYRYLMLHNPPAGVPEAIGLTDFNLFPSRQASRLTEIKRRVMTTGCGERAELILDVSDERKIFDSWYEPMRDETGRIVGVLGAAIDVTDDRHLRAELIDARIEAERANEAKSRFLAAASHDLRQPMQAMRLFSSALGPWLTEPRAGEIAGKLDEAMTAAEQLLNALLDVSTLEAGIVTPRLDTVRAGTLLDRLAREFGPMAEGAGLRLRVRCQDALIETDPVLLERMLRNLVHNALRYTRQGGILLATRRSGGSLKFQVWDTGIGIPADKQQAVFEDFYQVGNAQRDRSHGLGLGLSVVDRMSRLLDHPVTLGSREGKGSVFTVSVPVASSWAANRRAAE